MIDFYGRLLDQQSLWSERENLKPGKESSKGILRTKPIIRLENNEHIAHLNYGKIRFTCMETKSEYRTVKHTLTKKKIFKFLKSLD